MRKETLRILLVFSTAAALASAPARGAESSSDAAAAAAPLTLKSLASVEGPVVMLSDVVAEPLSAATDLELAASPPWGSTKVLTASFVRARLGRASRDLAGADRVAVSRPAVDRAPEVRRTVDSILAAEFAATPWGRSGGALGVAFDRFPAPLPIPPGAMRVSCAFPRSVRGSQTVSFTVACAGGFERRYSASCRFSVSARCAVASRNLPAGTTVSEDDVRWIETDIAACYEPPVLAGERVAGMVLDRFIASGGVVPRHALAAAPDAARGEIVTIAIERGPVVVSARGRSLGDGRVGERILVKNLASGTVGSYYVTGKGTVSPSPKGQ